MDEPIPPRPLRGALALEAAAFAMLALAAVGLTVFGGRREIARSFAEDWLRERGVESGFVIEEVGNSAFVGRVRLGSERDPVFSAERVEVAYDLTPPWSGSPFKLSTQAVRLVRPRIKVTWDGKTFSAGPLDPLIKEFLARPPSGDPGPALLIEGAHATVVTPNGVVRLTGDAAIDDSDLLRFDGRLLPARLTGEDFTAVTDGGAIRLRQANGRLTADLRLALDYAGLVELENAEAAIEGVLPYPDFKAMTVTGPVALRTAVRADRLTGDKAAVSAPEANFRLTGSANGQTFTGRLTGAARAATLTAGEVQSSDLHAAIDLKSLTAGRETIAGSGRIDARAGPSGMGDLALTRTAALADIRFQNLDFTADAEVSGRGAYRLDVEDRAIAAALRDFEFRAPVRLSPDEVALRGTAVATTASGGRATISPQGEGFDLTLAGGGLPEAKAQVVSYTLQDGGLDARVAVWARHDIAPAEDAEIDVTGRLLMGGGRTAFVLAECGEVSAAKVADAEHVRARLCPADQPLVSMGDTLRLAGRFERLEGSAFEVKAEGASGRFDVTGSRVAAQFEGARVSGPNFNTVRVDGRLGLTDGVVRGTFPVAGVGKVTLVHDTKSGRGQADIDAPMVFDPKGLQPAQLSPLANAVRNADGSAAFVGRIAWTRGGSTSSGTLAVRNLSFASPAGTVSGLDTTIAFTSLAPLAAAPAIVTVKSVNAVVPLSDIAGTFAIADESVQVAALSATAAKGRVSLEPTAIPLQANETIRGVLALDDVDIGEIVAASTLAEKVSIDAVVDGRLPFAFGPEGLRFTDGRIAAIKPGRIVIDRTALTSVQANPMDAAPEVNAIQDFAYQAMENLSFDTLEAGVNSAEGGRLAILFRIKGEHDPKVAEQARVGLQELLTGQAFKRRIPLPKGTPVDLTLDTSLNFDELLADWRRQWARSDAVQPPP